MLLARMSNASSKSSMTCFSTISILNASSSVEVASYEEEQVNRSDRLIEECEQECDAVLFTGCAIESFVGRNYHFTRPHVSVEKSVISIAGAFLQMQKSNIELSISFILFLTTSQDDFDPITPTFTNLSPVLRSSIQRTCRWQLLSIYLNNCFKKGTPQTGFLFIITQSHQKPQA